MGTITIENFRVTTHYKEACFHDVLHYINRTFIGTQKDIGYNIVS